MTPAQQYFLRRINLRPFLYTQADLLMLKSAIDDEVEIRQSIRSKELSLDLAKKVEAGTGNDQHVQELKDDLFLARKTYAKRLSQFDDYKNIPGHVPYDIETGLPYGVPEDKFTPSDDVYITQLSDLDRLRPLTPEEIGEEDAPIWQVSEVLDDGTERVIGNQ